MICSLENLLSSEPIKEILCYHNVSTDFYTGDNPPYHRHDAYEIYLFIKGNTKMYIGANCYQLTRGDFAIIPPGQLHRSIVTDTVPYERLGVNITEDALRLLSTRHTNLLAAFQACTHQIEYSLLHLSTPDIEKYTAITDQYLAASLMEKYGSDLKSLQQLTELLLFTSLLFRERTNRIYENVMPRIVSDTMKYVAGHLAEDLSLTQLSSSLNYSKNYIRSQFKQHTGLSLREYILDQRIEYAKQLLAEGRSVSDACLTSGFGNYSNFIRSFKNKTGLSPGRFGRHS